MIRVLQSFEEVGRAIEVLQRAGCGYHADPMKNWDLAQINAVLDELKRDSYILDMGCGGSQVLKFLHKKGFKNCFGIDISITLEDRLTQLQLMYKDKTLKTPYKLLRKDLTRTNFPQKSFDTLVCLSVIEHGVNVDSFFRESSRVLKPKGTLFVSTDYWEPKISTSDVPKPFNLDWNIFSRKEIRNLIDIAKSYRLKMEDEDIPPTREKIIHWNGKNYTSLSIMFKKE